MFRKPILFFLLAIALSSCLKNADKTADGPKSQIGLTNYVVNGASFEAFLNDSKITASPLSFGASIGSGNNIYTAISSGLHNLKISSGGSLVMDKTIFFESDKKYSVLLFDTLKSNIVKVLQLNDDIVPVDTIAKARFLQLIPDKDSLRLLLIKNTGGILITDVYAGNKTAENQETSFYIIIEPGTYRLQLIKNNLVIYELASQVILPGKVYSFIAKGLPGGTGVYKENVDVVQHN